MTKPLFAILAASAIFVVYGVALLGAIVWDWADPK